MFLMIGLNVIAQYINHPDMIVGTQRAASLQMLTAIG